MVIATSRLTRFLAFLFGGVFMGAGFLYALLNAALLPLGLSPFANELYLECGPWWHQLQRC